jgi:hypothetical protein
MESGFEPRSRPQRLHSSPFLPEPGLVHRFARGKAGGGGRWRRRASPGPHPGPRRPGAPGAGEGENNESSRRPVAVSIDRAGGRGPRGWGPRSQLPAHNYREKTGAAARRN